MSSDNHLRPIEVYLRGCNPPPQCFHQCIWKCVDLCFSLLCYYKNLKTVTALEYDTWDNWICILRPWSLIFDSRVYYLLLSLRRELCQQRLGENNHWEFHHCHSSYTMVSWLTYYCGSKASWWPLEKITKITPSAPCWVARRKQTNHKREPWTLARLLEAKIGHPQGRASVKIRAMGWKSHPKKGTPSHLQAICLP